MSYATVEQLREWFTSTRVENYVSDDAMVADERLQEALDAAAGEMDASFQRSGYSVPVDAADAGALETELERLLARHCITLALDHLRLGLDALPQNITDQVRLSRLWLGDLRGAQGFRTDGTVGRVFTMADLPGLARVA